MSTNVKKVSFYIQGRASDTRQGPFIYEWEAMERAHDLSIAKGELVDVEQHTVTESVEVIATSDPARNEGK